VEIRANQRAQQAASGVLVDSGSALVIQEDTFRLAQADAVTTMFDAINRKTEVESAGQFEDLASFSRERAAILQGQSTAAAARAQGTAALIGGISSAAGSLSNTNLSTFSSGSVGSTGSLNAQAIRGV
jgi:hypothetical protein